MLPAIFADAKFWGLLLRFDEDVAAGVQASGCLCCGAALHSARYRRKPRGVARSLLGEEYGWRLSFCCARDGCRRRTTPPSVRFLARGVYLGAFVLLVSALTQGLTCRRRRELCTRLRVSERTILRWRRWWREVFASTPWWRGVRGQFVPALDVARLPASLLERFVAAAPERRVLDALCFLAPLSSESEQAR